MRVVEARQDQFAPGIDDASVGSRETYDVAARADCGDAIAGNGDCFGRGAIRIDCADDCVCDDQLDHGWTELAFRRNHGMSRETESHCTSKLVQCAAVQGRDADDVTPKPQQNNPGREGEFYVEEGRKQKSRTTGPALLTQTRLRTQRA